MINLLIMIVWNYVTKTYNQKCINCTNKKCTLCIDSYFVFNNTECIKSLDNCMVHYYDRFVKYCTLCKEDHYCINKKIIKAFEHIYPKKKLILIIK